MTEKNVWRVAESEQLIEAMRLCGCDARYIDGQVSDYERLCELLRVADKLRGHKALEEFIARVNKSTELNVCNENLIVENARIIWHSVDKNQLSESKKSYENIVEKYNFHKSIFVLNDIKKERHDYQDLVDDIKRTICEKQANVFARLTNSYFAAPNPYLAKQILDNCQKIQDDILICQILCEIMLDERCQKTQIYLDTNGNYEYVRQYVTFLGKHNMGARMSITVRAEDNVENILDTCRLSNEKFFITPCIFATNNDTAEKLSDFKSRLSKIYPIGMLTVIE